MREIKFRSWINEEQCYSEEPFWRILLCKDGKIYNSENDTYYNHDERYTIEQFTGLKDKNGTEIYEGDIIDIHQTVNGFSKFVIVNCLGGYDVRYWHDNQPQRKYEYDVTELLEVNIDECEKEIEVIGNIHEKPELTA